MFFGPAAFRTAIVCLSALVPACLHAEGIDTEHLFGFTIGTDVGSPGEREFQSQTTGRFSKSGGNYRAINQELELEYVPSKNFRIEVGSAFASYDINGVAGFEDRRQLAWQGISVDLRYRFLDRDLAPFGLTFALETHADRIDDRTAALARRYSTELRLALDRELIPNRVATQKLSFYQKGTFTVGNRLLSPELRTVQASTARSNSKYGPSATGSWT